MRPMLRNHLLQGARFVRREYHLWQLWMVIGHRDGARLYPPDDDIAQGRWLDEDAETGTVSGSLALMPALVPKREHMCAEGHPMIFRTIPIQGYENMLIFGCIGEKCPHSMIIRLKQIAAEYGIQT